MKILYVTTIGGTMSFFNPLIKTLIDAGNQVEIACNNTRSRVPEFYTDLGCKIHTVTFSRSPLSSANAKAYRQLKAVVAEGKYDIVHCHTPNAAAVTRLVCQSFRKKTGMKVFYTAHGLHFHDGAPLKNWLIYYPIEKFCARRTDKLITINQEDYERAKRKLHAGEVLYVPGVGLDIAKFQNVQVDRVQKRQEIGVPADAFLLMSVGEMNDNKNHQIILKAMGRLKNPQIHYALAGSGARKDALRELACELGVTEQFHLLGSRRDVAELNHSADAFCFPSYREGLGVAALEAMACGLPLITSNVHGINDYSRDGVTGYKCSPNDVEGFATAISKLYKKRDACLQFGAYNEELVKKYAVDNIVETMRKMYEC